MYEEEKRGFPKIILVILFLVVAIGSFFGGSIYGSLNSPVILPDGGGSSTNDSSFDKLFEVKDVLHQQYYQDIDDEALLEGAIKGMVDAVGDPYTVFFNQEEYQEFQDDGQGNYVGIGVMVGIKEDKIVVITPFEGSPAYEAGIRAGDFILKVEGVEYKGSEMDKAVSVIKGEEGKPVTLTISQNGVEKDVTIVRASITLVNVQSEVVAGNIGHVTMLQFTNNTAKQVREAMEELKAQGAEGYILDLRGNPGGYLDEAVDTASLFVEKGKTVLYTLDKAQQKREYLSKGGDFIGAPLVVLLDEGSASASEVVAGALKDYKAATIVGQKSFGKGIVQMVFNVGNKEGVKVTVSSYYSPNGINIHGEGILPDVEVQLPEGVEAPLTIDNDTQLQKAVEILQDGLQ
ncbi:S41 family peptidase [Proteiniclasticum ruminis]|uniref:C-terminal processing peptidase-3. Serine peptidase. MEROPS family S41A n=1 Tax=Proteiniclasticum ruminis TaxID=398199 RepID=A0A1I5DNK9_9CLOT|nr:S41 family peptidase [Proteiniclasticum ruminis]SFO00766.1 C-terminal processing peptidase-3. Serine peptidase. MEROPS family S41A [Proteiniclasticum ruminis]